MGEERNFAYSAEMFVNAGAHYVARTLSDCDRLLDEIELRLRVTEQSASH